MTDDQLLLLAAGWKNTRAGWRCPRTGVFLNFETALRAERVWRARRIGMDDEMAKIAAGGGHALKIGGTTIRKGSVTINVQDEAGRVAVLRRIFETMRPEDEMYEAARGVIGE